MDTDVTKMEGKRLQVSLLQRWYGVRQRSKPNFWVKKPTYTGTSVCPRWRDSFEDFLYDVLTLRGHDLLDGNGKALRLTKIC